MNKLKLARIGLIVNAVFWLALIPYYYLFMQGTNVDSLFVKGILLIEAVLYVALYVGLKNKNRFVYILALIVTGANAFLSIADQVGVHDIISFVLSLVAFVLLVMSIDQFKSRSKN